jgi:hypothetical protein
LILCRKLHWHESFKSMFETACFEQR